MSYRKLTTQAISPTKKSSLFSLADLPCIEEAKHGLMRREWWGVLIVVLVG